MLGPALVRVTVIDSTRVVSFLCSDDVPARLVAGCSSNPATLEELLLATEAFQRGITRAVFDGLIEFDRRLARGESAQVQGEALDSADGLITGVIEAGEAALVHQVTRHSEAWTLLVIDLPHLVCHASPKLALERRATVQVHDGRSVTIQSVTYELPGAWSLHDDGPASL
jgi:hypothetical protein